MDIIEQILHLAQTTELTDSEIAEQLGVTRQKVTRTKSKHIQSGLGDKVESILEATGIAKAV